MKKDPNPLALPHGALRSLERGSTDFGGRGHGCFTVAAVVDVLSSDCSVDEAEFRGYPRSEDPSEMRCGPQS
jgi:hypothetical protein